MTEREKQDLSDIFAALGMNSDQITVGQVVGTQVIMYPGAHVHVDNKERAGEPIPEAEEVESEEVDTPETADDGFDADTCGLKKCFYTHFAWHYIWQNHADYKNTTYWAAVYCVLLEHKLIERNDVAFCEWAQKKWGAKLNRSTVSRLLSEQSQVIRKWDIADPRRKAARQPAMNMLLDLEAFRKQYVEHVKHT